MRDERGWRRPAAITLEQRGSLRGRAGVRRRPREPVAPALDAYRRGDWQETLRSWESHADAYPDDAVAAVFVARLHRWAQEGWPDGWDGVYTLESNRRYPLSSGRQNDFAR